jgi:hypothetical protein
LQREAYGERVDSDEGEDSNEDEDEEDEDDNANQPPLEISISLTLFLTSSGGFAVKKLLAVTRPTNRSILCLGLDSEDRCMRGLRIRSCKSTVFPMHIRNPLCEFLAETFLSGV